MMKLEDYEKLPDRMDVEVLLLMFRNILVDFEQENISKNEFLKIINELMERQVMSYELLENNIRKELDNVICNLWNVNSYDDVDIILSIVVNLGLKKCYELIKESISNEENIDKEILQEILEMLTEVGDNIENPYYTLENLKQ